MESRALLSVSDKRGLVPFAQGLAAQGVTLIASGGTARVLKDAGLAVQTVESVTGCPELLDGRVKTLHPAIHGGILSRRTDAEAAQLAEQSFGHIDWVVCNLYPFQQGLDAGDGADESTMIELIDIGGVTLLRAAAKNHAHVSVVSDPDDYAAVLAECEAGGVSAQTRRRLAAKAFRHTASYDAAIASWFGGQAGESDELPATLTLHAERQATLRYGENPHQAAALYRWAGVPLPFERIGGQKELSYNNLVDLDAAWGVVHEFDRPAVAVIKHTNPCGAAVAEDVHDALARAIASDPVSAFGSIIATNQQVDAAFVKGLGKLFLEVLAAPSYTEDALEILARRKKNCRVVRLTGPYRSGSDGVRFRAFPGGLLAQTADAELADDPAWKIVSERAPSDKEKRDLRVAWAVCKHVSSNAIVLVRDEATVGVGAGQMNRVEAVRLAAHQAKDRAKGAVMASDAFFPFADGLQVAADHGVTAVIQPGGSIRDDEVLAEADQQALTMVFTGERHFRH